MVFEQLRDMSSTQHTLHTKLLNNQLRRLMCVFHGYNLQLSNHHLDDSPFSQKKGRCDMKHSLEP